MTYFSCTDAVEIEQMRCAGCGSMFPPRELTYNTGLCRTCLDFQLTLLAERQPLIAATFRVLERRLLGGFAAEIKRDIYEEIYAPTPEPEAAPTPEPSWICANCETSQTGEKYNFRIGGQPQKVCNACWSKLSTKLVADTKETLRKIDEKHKQQAEPSKPESEYLKEHPNSSESQVIPDTNTNACKDCAWFDPRCSWLLSKTPESRCDWIPSRFTKRPQND